MSSLFEIKHRYSNAVLFSLETESLKVCVQEAVRLSVDLRGAFLEGANFGVANFGVANFRGANLRGANFEGANFGDANLEGANLEGANLEGVNLRGAFLEGANFRGANLGVANFRGANLEGADLRDADLRGADFDGADLCGAKGIIHIGTPNGWHAHAWLRDGWLSIRVGCREFRLPEARAYWAGKDDRRVVMAALDYAEAVAAILEWPLVAPTKLEAA